MRKKRSLKNRRRKIKRKPLRMIQKMRQKQKKLLMKNLNRSGKTKIKEV